MGGIFGGGTTVQTGTKYDYLNITTSTFGEPIPIVFGTHKVSGNCIDYIDFTIITNRQTSGKGGSVTTESYTYEVAAAVGLCEGEITGIGRIWDSNTAYKKNAINSNFPLDTATQTALNALYYDSDGNTLSIEEKLSVFYGSKTQSAWSYMQSKHPDRALNYPYLAYVAGYLSLGSSNSLPSFGFEVLGQHIYGNGNLDCEPYLMNTELLTNPVYGINYPITYLADMTTYRNYCLASGIFLSYPITSQTEVSEVLNNIIKATNSQPVVSQGILYFKPYGTATITGNGVTYTPDLTPIYSLSDADYIYDEADPVQMGDDDTSGVYNFQQLTFKNRKSEYASDTINFVDQASINLIGIKKADAVSLDCITTADVASVVLQNMAERTINHRRQFTFKLPYFPFVLLDPMDIVASTEQYLGLDMELVRINSLEIDDEKYISFTVEEVGITGNGTVAYPRQEPVRTSSNLAVDPGDTNTPIIFDPPAQLTGGQLATWIAASGQSKNWGGCSVWVSLDGDSYKKVGKVFTGIPMGKLSAILPTGTSPDTTNTLAVDLTQSNGELSSGTLTDANNYVTICYVDGELVAYQTATLMATNKYNLTYLLRGVYGSTISAHSANSQFARLNDNVFKYGFDDVNIGQTIYIKLTSFNIFGANEQSLSDVTAYTHTLTNKGKGAVGASYTHYQATASTTWTITHNLNKYPSVSCVDSSGNLITGSVNYVSANELTIAFSQALAGSAYLT